MTKNGRSRREEFRMILLLASPFAYSASHGRVTLNFLKRFKKQFNDHPKLLPGHRRESS